MNQIALNYRSLTLFSIILLLAVLLTPACKKDDPDNNNPTNPTTFSAKIDGQPFGEFNFANVYYREKSLLVEIYAKTNGEFFRLYIVGFNGIGIYPLERGNTSRQQNVLSYQIDIDQEEAFHNTFNAGGPGIVQVTSFDPNGFISLSFACQLNSVAATGAVEITDGLLVNGEVTRAWPLETPPSHVLAAVDGLEFVAYPQQQFPGAKLQIDAFDGGSRAVRLVIPDGIAPGTYDLATSTFEGSGFTAGTDFFPVTSGTLQIAGSSFNTAPAWVRGAFQFVSAGNHIVTNGDFYVED